MKEENYAFLEKCSKEYLAQLERCNDPGETVEKVFLDIMDQLENTVFYHDHKLEGVSTLGEFKGRIPIRTYQDFDCYIDLILKGAQNVLSKSTCFAFYKTSGTSGRSKYIPSTYHWRQEYRGPALYAQWGLYFKLIKAKSLAEEHVLDISWARKQSNQKASIPIYSITSRPSTLGGNDWNPPWHDSSWFFSEKDIGHTEAMVKTLVETAINDVRIIVSVNPSKIVSLYETLNSSLTAVTQGLEMRQAHEADSQVLSKIDLLLERLSGKESVTLTDLWPNLDLLVCWRSASAGKYIQWLNHAAPNVPIVPFSTVGTEGIVSIPVDSSASGGALSIDQGLYEFVDIDTLSDPAASLAPDHPTLDYSQLEVGKRYRLVMSQANGIYRYDTQDVYKVVGWVGKTPRIDFVGRSNVGSSFTGEKLSEDNIYQAVRRTLNGLCEKLPLFSCIPVWGNPPHYVITVEAEDQALVENHAVVERHLQDQLCAVNEEYADKCSSHRLEALRLVLLRPGAFSVINKINVNNGISSAQVKHLWIQPNDRLLKLFESHGLSMTDTAEVAE